MGSFLMMTCFLCTTISSGMFITAMAANPLAVNLASEALGTTISWGARGCVEGVGVWRVCVWERVCGGLQAWPSSQLEGSRPGRCPRRASPSNPLLTPPPPAPPPSPPRPGRTGTWALSALVPGLTCLLLTPALMYVLYPPQVKDTPDAPAKVRALACRASLLRAGGWAGGWVGALMHPPPAHATRAGQGGAEQAGPHVHR